MNKITPLTENETTELLRLLRKLCAKDSGANNLVRRNAKSLYHIIDELRLTTDEALKNNPF